MWLLLVASSIFVEVSLLLTSLLEGVVILMAIASDMLEEALSVSR